MKCNIPENIDRGNRGQFPDESPSNWFHWLDAQLREEGLYHQIEVMDIEPLTDVIKGHYIKVIGTKKFFGFIGDKKIAEIVSEPNEFPHDDELRRLPPHRLRYEGLEINAINGPYLSSIRKLIERYESVSGKKAKLNLVGRVNLLFPNLEYALAPGD